MRILILGASAGTGALAAKEALARGHEVTAFARSPQKLAIENPKLKKYPGDFHDPGSVDAAVLDHEAVIITASANRLKAFRENPNYFSQGTRNAIEAMKRHGVRRLVILSALGTGESAKLMSPIIRWLIVDSILKRLYQDHVRQEELVCNSGLEYVIARPSRLTNGPANRKYIATTAIERVPNTISRADVACFLIDAAEKPDWVGHAVQLGG